LVNVMKVKKARVPCISSLDGLFLVLALRFLVDNAEHLCFERFFILAQAVLFPPVVKDLPVEVLSGHAVLKETDHGLVIGLFFKLERPRHLHKLFELFRLPLAQDIQPSLDLLLLDRRVFFVLAAARESLPR